MAVPVPVPKQSLFKTKVIGKAIEELATKGLIESDPIEPLTVKLTAKGKALAETLTVKWAPGQPVEAVPLIPTPKAAPVTATEDDLEQHQAWLKESQPKTIDVVIPVQLYHMIMSKPSTGGGWQSIMAQLQAALSYQGTGTVTPTGSEYALKLSPWLLAKIVDKATIGSGGYQAVMRWVVCLAAKQHPGAVIAGKGE